MNKRWTWADIAAKWLREHPGWHETRAIAEAIGYQHFHNFAQVLHKIPGIQVIKDFPLSPFLWSLTDRVPEALEAVQHALECSASEDGRHHWRCECGATR